MTTDSGMTPEEQDVLDFMHAFQRTFGPLEAFRVVTPRFVAVSPGVKPDVPLGDGGRKPGRQALPRPAIGRASEALKGGYKCK